MRFVLLILSFLLTACAATPLERHIRSAQDVVALNAHVVESLDAFCAAEQSHAVCRTYVGPAQAALATSLDAWIEALDRERDADHWDEPQDGVEASNVGSAYDALAQVCATHEVETLPLLPASYCAHTSAASCPPREEE